MSVYQKAHDLESTLSLFDRAVDCRVAQTDVYNDVMSSCMDSKKYKVCSSAVQVLMLSQLDCKQCMLGHIDLWYLFDLLT